MEKSANRNREERKSVRIIAILNKHTDHKSNRKHSNRRLKSTHARAHRQRERDYRSGAMDDMTGAMTRRRSEKGKKDEAD